MRINGFNLDHITSLVRQIDNNTDPEVLATITKQHSGQMQDIVSSISEVRSDIASKMQPITKLPAPTSAAIVRWANKVALGVAHPQLKAQTSYTADVASAGGGLTQIMSSLDTLKNAVLESKAMVEDVRSELVTTIDSAMVPTAELEANINSIVEEGLTSIAESQALVNSLTGSTTTYDTSDAETFLATYAETSATIDAEVSTILAAIAPLNTVVPTISGNTYVDNTLTCTANGTWTGTDPVTFRHQWQRSGADIPGANTTTYLLGFADRAETIRCAVFGENVADSVVAYSTNTAPIKMLPYLNTAPVISGGNTISSNLVCTAGQWTSTAFVGPPVFQWYRNSINIAGANTFNYVVVGPDVGTSLHVQVEVTNEDGTSYANSAPLNIV